jgi:hypothetical protein
MTRAPGTCRYHLVSAQDRLSRLVDVRLPDVHVSAVHFEADFSPVRLKKAGRRARYNGRFASLKAGRAMPWESRNERLGLEMAEVDPARADLRVQPFRLEMIIAGARSAYTPDRLDLLRTGVLRCVEVKQNAQAVDDADRCKMRIVKALLGRVGMEFSFEFGDDLRVQAGRDLIERVLHYRRTAILISDLALIDRLSRGWRWPFSYGTMVTAYGDEAAAFGRLAALIVRGRLSVSLGADLSEDSLVVPIEGRLAHA